MLVFAGLAWLLAGLLSAVVMGSLLLAGLPVDDPRRATLTLAAVLLGVGVTLVGFAVTIRLAGRRAASSRPPGALAVNTLRDDAVQRPRPAFGRTPSPVPPVTAMTRGRPRATRPWKPGSPPRPVPMPPLAMGAVQRLESPISTGPWGWTPGGHAAAQRPKATIPGAQTVATARAARDAYPASASLRAGVAAPVLGFAAGCVLAFEQSAGGAISPAGWVLFAGLLVVAGALTAATPPRRGPTLRVLGVAPAVPILVAGIAAADSRGSDPGTFLVLAFLVYFGAGVLLRIGAALGGAGAARRST